MNLFSEKKGSEYTVNVEQLVIGFVGGDRVMGAD